MPCPTTGGDLCHLSHPLSLHDAIGNTPESGTRQPREATDCSFETVAGCSNTTYGLTRAKFVKFLCGWIME